MTEKFKDSKLMTLFHKVSHHIEARDEELYRRALSETTFNFGIPLLFGKNKLSNAFMYALILVTALSIAASGLPGISKTSASETPQPTPTIPIAPALVGGETLATLTGEEVQKTLIEQGWDCRIISEKYPNSFRVALDAGVPGIVDPPPYLFDPQGNEPPHEVSVLPRLVHNGDNFCVDP